MELVFFIRQAPAAAAQRDWGHNLIWLFPIRWIVIWAVMLYRLTVEIGKLEASPAIAGCRRC